MCTLLPIQQSNSWSLIVGSRVEGVLTAGATATMLTLADDVGMLSVNIDAISPLMVLDFFCISL